MEQKHLVFFTGGLDSTYRLCQLAQEDCVVQPVYILFYNDGINPHFRPEILHEIESQDKVLNYIVNHPDTKAKFLPIERVDSSVLRFDGMDKWETLLAKAGLGWQYIYCSVYARLNKGIEICQEVFPKGYYDRNLFVFDRDAYGRTIVKPNKNTSKWMQEYVEFIWSNMSYPVYGVTRHQMKDDLKRWGYDDVWKQVWFCYKSINGKPCGVCDNCRTKIREGLTELFDKDAMRRYYISRIIAFNYDVELSKLYCLYICDGEDEFISLLVTNSLNNRIKPLNRHWIQGLKKLFSMNVKGLRRMYEKSIKEVKA